MAVKKKAPTDTPESKSNNVPQAAPVATSKADKPPTDSERQLRALERAMKFFHQRQFQEAKDAFTAVIGGPQKEVSHNAKMHIVMCERRLASVPVPTETHEDHYNQAVVGINARDLDGARKHLDCAMDMVRKDGNTATDHLYYALALCASLSGDADGAYKSLKQAIELNPQNRAAARQDSDLAQIAQQPAIQELLYPEKAGRS